MSRPICVHCGKAHGRRKTKHETITRATANDPWPRYAGDGVVVKDAWVVNSSATVAYRIIRYDATWVTPYQPFCTLRCALDYARKAYAQGVGARPPKLKAMEG